MIASGGKRNPAKLDLNADTRRGRRLINPACLILFPTDATVPPLVPYIQDQAQVGACTLSADRLCAAALSKSDSADAIVACIETLKTSSED